MTAHPMTSIERDLPEDKLRAHLKLKYIGNCKCGECQLVPLAVITEAADALASIRAERDEAREVLRDCAAILPHYRLMGKTLGDDEVLDQVLERARAIAGEQKHD